MSDQIQQEINEAIIQLSNLEVSRHDPSLQVYAELLWNNKGMIDHTTRSVCATGEKLIPVIITDSEKLMNFEDPDGRTISLLRTGDGFVIFRQEIQH